MLRLEGLNVVQGEFALKADWSVPQGTRVSIIGPSGGGKSTLLSTIAGFLTPKAGRILWDEKDITHMPPGMRPVSVIFQDNNLFPHLSVEQNVGLAVRPDLRLTDQDRQSVSDALSRVGLSGKEHALPAQLSGGQAARVAIARALLQARSLLLLDEPFAALGPALKAEMLTLVGEVAEAAGTTVLLVSHDPLDAKRFADLTVLVADGVAEKPALTQSLFAAPPPALGAYLGASSEHAKK